VNDPEDIAKHIVTAASIHSAITSLSVAVGRLDERLQSMDRALNYHTKEEHAEFRETRELAAEIKAKVDALVELEGRLTLIESTQSQQRGAWLALAKIGAVFVAIVTIVSAIWHMIESGKAI
jgi:hypothetical protein